MTANNFNSQQDMISLTSSALRHFKVILESNKDKLIRFSTKLSGCSGYVYVMDLVEKSHSSDGITLAIDIDALGILRGTKIDIEEDGVNRQVKFNNPNVTGECGCGESFTTQ